MKKGFTLIELLAVIVILAVVALIATPLILNVIDDSKKGAFKSTAYGIIEAAELNYAKIAREGVYQEVSYTYEDGNEHSSVEGAKLNFKGQPPQNGEVKVNSDGEVALAIHDGKYCVEKTFDSTEVKISETPEEECQLISFPTGRVCGDNFIDDRDTENVEIYKTVKIGNQCWMAENLRYTSNGCLNNTWNSSEPHNACREHNASDGTTGYLDWTESQVVYQWEAIMNGPTDEVKQGICPNGWHISTDDDWKMLEGYVDSNYEIGDSAWDDDDWVGSDVGTKLKSSVYSDGTDDYGFNGLPVGDRGIDGALRIVGARSCWWTSTIGNFSSPWTRLLRTDQSGILHTLYMRDAGCSVRCILD